MSTAAALPDLAVIDATLAKGAWWLRLVDDLSDHATRRSAALAKGVGRRPIFGEMARLAHAIGLAVVLAFQLRAYLKAQAQRRAMAPVDLAAAETPVTTWADGDAAWGLSVGDEADPEPAARSVVIAPWERAAQAFSTAVPQGVQRRTPRAQGAAMRVDDLRVWLNPPPCLPPRPG